MQIKAFGPKAAARIDKVRRGVTLKLFNSIVLDTPVDTGRLRANWRVSVTKPELDARPELTDKSGALPMAEIKATTDQSTGDDPVFLTNNLPYAYTVEFGLYNGPTEKVTAEGFSKKAKAGMVRKNVVRFARLIDIEARRNRREY